MWMAVDCETADRLCVSVATLPSPGVLCGNQDGDGEARQQGRKTCHVFDT